MATLKLSEAIRLGSMMNPQAFGRLKGVDGSTCALGAAGDAVGLSIPEEIYMESLLIAFPIVGRKYGLCPACLMGEFLADLNWSVGGLIGHLNDHHKWTREEIAELVETIEQQAAAEALAVNAEPIPA